MLAMMQLSLHIIWKPAKPRPLSAGHDVGFVELEYYSDGNSRDFLDNNRTEVTLIELRRWEAQMISSVGYIHFKDVLHSDLRLDQWYLHYDRNMNGFLLFSAIIVRVIGWRANAAIEMAIGVE